MEVLTLSSDKEIERFLALISYYGRLPPSTYFELVRVGTVELNEVAIWMGQKGEYWGSGKCVQLLKRRIDKYNLRAKHHKDWRVVLAKSVLERLVKLGFVGIIKSDDKTMIKPLIKEVRLDLGAKSTRRIRGYEAVHKFLRSTIKIPQPFGKKLICSEPTSVELKKALKKLYTAKSNMIIQFVLGII